MNPDELLSLARSEIQARVSYLASSDFLETWQGDRLTVEGASSLIEVKVVAGGGIHVNIGPLIEKLYEHYDPRWPTKIAHATKDEAPPASPFARKVVLD